MLEALRADDEFKSLNIEAEAEEDLDFAELVISQFVHAKALIAQCSSYGLDEEGNEIGADSSAAKQPSTKAAKRKAPAKSFITSSDNEDDDENVDVEEEEGDDGDISVDFGGSDDEFDMDELGLADDIDSEHEDGQQGEDEDDDDKPASKAAAKRRKGDVKLGGSVFASAEEFQNLIDENVRLTSQQCHHRSDTGFDAGLRRHHGHGALGGGEAQEQSIPGALKRKPQQPASRQVALVDEICVIGAMSPYPPSKPVSRVSIARQHNRMQCDYSSVTGNASVFCHVIL